MINFNIQSQPDDETCGPTCLHSVYNYYGYDIGLDEVIHSIERSLSGGTLAPLLGKHALQHGFEASIYINNLQVFDPTWFDKGEAMPENLLVKLRTQLHHKRNKGMVQESKAYIDFLELGGNIKFHTLSVALLKDCFADHTPILTGLSCTYLYQSARELFSKKVSYYDDIRGQPCGHFVVLCGYDESNRHVIVADPARSNPLSHDNYYKVNSQRLINAILLGVLTYDANMLIIKPKRKPDANHIGN